MQLLKSRFTLILVAVLVLILVAWVMGTRLMADCIRDEFVENFRSAANPNVSQSELYTDISEDLIRRDRESTRETLLLVHDAITNDRDPYELDDVDSSAVDVIHDFDPDFTQLSEGVTDEYLDSYLEFRVNRALLATEQETLEQAWQNEEIRYNFLPNCGPLKLLDFAEKALFLLAAGVAILLISHRVRALNRKHGAESRSKSSN